MGQLHKNIISMKWIDKMVERITRKETALNDHFCVNRHTVVCQSGMTDLCF